MSPFRDRVRFRVMVGVIVRVRGRGRGRVRVGIRGLSGGVPCLRRACGTKHIPVLVRGIGTVRAGGKVSHMTIYGYNPWSYLLVRVGLVARSHRMLRRSLSLLLRLRRCFMLSRICVAIRVRFRALV